MVRRRTTSGPTRLRTARVAGFTLTEGIHAAGTGLPWHHHDGPTLCFVLQGAFTETSGGERLTCTPETLKVMPAGERHCDDFDQGDARGLLVETDAERARAIRTHAPVLDERVAFHGGMPAAIARRVYQEFRRMDDAAPLAIEGLLLELLAAVSRRRSDDLPEGSAPWVGRGPRLPPRRHHLAAHAGGAGRRGRRAPGDPGAHLPADVRVHRGRVSAPPSDRAGRRSARRVATCRWPRSRLPPGSRTRATSPTSSAAGPACPLRRSAARPEGAERAARRPLTPAASSPAAGRSGDRRGADRAAARP